MLAENVLSLHPETVGDVPEETARLARAAFPKLSPVLRLRGDMGVIYTTGGALAGKTVVAIAAGAGPSIRRESVCLKL